MRTLAQATLLSLCVMACLPVQTHAHALRTSTARLTLREGHIEVALEVDMLAWLAHLREEEEASAGAPDDDAGSASRGLARARADLQNESQLRVDGKALRFEIRRFPEVGDLARAIMASQAGAVDPNASVLLPIKLEARVANQTPRSVSLRFPHELDPVLVTFVQPRSQVATADRAARFDVLAAHERDHTNAVGNKTSMPGLAWLGTSAVLACAALLSTRLVRRWRAV